MATVFQSTASMMEIESKSALIKAPNSMSFVERYHTPVRRLFRNIKSEADDLSDEAALQTAVKLINDPIGQNSFILNLLE